MPKWVVHRKYALKFLNEMYNSSFNHESFNDLVRDIDLLIDFPNVYFSKKNIQWIISRLKMHDPARCSNVLLVISLYYMGIGSASTVHDWRVTRKNRSDLVKLVAYCIYGEIGAKVVDLHSALDRIKQANIREYEEFHKWALSNRLDNDVIDFIKSYWNKIIKDIFGE